MGVFIVINKSLRVLIAEPSRQFARELEKMLNRLGYYSVLPVHSANDASVLGRSDVNPFDLMIGNVQLVGEPAPDGAAGARVAHGMANLLFYSDASTKAAAEVKVISSREGTILLSEGPPSFECIRSLMARIDRRPHLFIGQAIPLHPSRSKGMARRKPSRSNGEAGASL